MHQKLPELSKQINSSEIFSLIEEKYTEIVPVWMPLQVEWMNGLYRTFKDPEKFLIIMHLLGKTFDNYSQNFVKLDYDEYFNQNEIEIATLNVMEISKSLNIPKETARRKIIELEELNAIKRSNKKIIIDKNTWPNIKPEDTITRVSRFLSFLSKMLYQEKKISEVISSKQIASTVEEYFSYIWKLYYDMQKPMLLNFKERFGDIESFHIWGICIVNQIFSSLKNDNSYMSKELYLEKYLFRNEGLAGVNAMSISDISGIPRATVIRKLNKMVKNDYLRLDDKKHYLTTGFHAQELKEVQKNNLQNLSKFASRIYNLTILKKNKL
tara:strand:- start:175 stop:1149 length:975 start_codon:yes stop_codon:yes gene_type:complete